MQEPHSECFYGSWDDHRNGRISFEVHLRNNLRHILGGTRHNEDAHINDKEVMFWSERDLTSAAVMVCMLHSETEVSEGLCSFHYSDEALTWADCEMYC